MTNKGIELTRRKILASMGAVGAAGAVAGMGTSAYFSDEESFTDNSLTAGTLDLKIDWTEHYYDGSQSLHQGVDSVSTESVDGMTGFPSTAPASEQVVFVDDEQQFMANTAIEAFPDILDEEDEDDYDAQKERIDDDICDLLADLDGALDHPLRTRGTFGGDANPQTTEPGDPLVSIGDVKPGDFGEVTFSFHLCGNPGYVWLTGALVDASENSHTEPEADDPEERTDDDPDVDGEYVELLDAIRATVWYDTGEDGVYGAELDDKDDGEGDNIFGAGERLIPLMGSLRSVLEALEAGMFPLDPEPVANGNDNTNEGESDSEAPTVSGSIDEDTEHIDEIFATGDDDRFTGGPAKNYTCADYEDNLDQFAEGDLVGSEVLNPDDAPIQVGSNYVGCTTITVAEFDENTGTITLSSTSPVQIVSIKGGPNGEQVYVFAEPVVLDEATFTTLGDHEISNIDICCPVGDSERPPDKNGDRCFENSTTAYIGFEWWVPEHVGNEIQGDSVKFDLGFYTEQCRHNDGSGQSPPAK
ncbi:SipW-dependent-type signal peptide-containing protein [Salinibaculum salinum]|uniref:SipW-dependent-type signal peptide-containing protein n=1 Tax=Salinibaculum salinum TaxID=3131996 RepID=UPI0030EE7A4C